ncbi:N-acetylmuramoyl-L-alanine amidase family protein [Mucilaginibacter gilvus]|uniref:N-acetylmuramoyl-L-alanine amidase n=1 Tax=Mucilaginibacter gilvus TaxID=2305909 RepID=A0A3S3YVA0_9SPHI|nr:N-acetylmuramoyl-L-alanine amidase [Mucilaginibacter gilvus]RWY51098.1 N-acetylmuramoyl-L-alanine amidase [Mucilaginibacter gilvus]
MSTNNSKTQGLYPKTIVYLCAMFFKPLTRAALLSCTIFFLAGACLAFAQSPVKTGDSTGAFRFRTIVIDPGHGGKDPGAHGAYSNEKTVALSIGKKLRDALNDQLPNINVIMTRSTDKFIELHNRAEIANDSKANLFISIHCNSTPQRVGTRRGAMLLLYGFHRKQEQLEALRENASIYQEKDYQKRYNGYGEDAAMNAIVLAAFQQRYRKQSVQFGELLNTEFTETDGRASVGVKEQGVLVLQQSGMPGLLIETGFINNPDDERYLNSDEGQNEIVQSVIRAIKKYKAGIGS